MAKDLLSCSDCPAKRMGRCPGVVDPQLCRDTLIGYTNELIADKRKLLARVIELEAASDPQGMRFA